MLSKQVNQYDMYLRVQKTLDLHKTIWGSNTRFTANYETFIGYLREIEAISGRLKERNKVASIQKAALRTQLPEATLGVVKKVKSFAVDTQDNDLYQAVDYSKSDLGTLQESLVPAVVATIHEKAWAVLAQLDEYGVTEAELQRISILTEKFNTIMPEPKRAISDTKQSTATLADLFRQNNDLLRKQLDGKLEQYQAEHPDFYTAYFNARQVINRNGRKGVEGALRTN